MAHWTKLIRDDRGVTAVEYSLILGFIFLAVVVGIKNFAATAVAMWEYVASQVVGA